MLGLAALREVVIPLVLAGAREQAPLLLPARRDGRHLERAQLRAVLDRHEPQVRETLEEQIEDQAGQEVVDVPSAMEVGDARTRPEAEDVDAPRVVAIAVVPGGADVGHDGDAGLVHPRHHGG